MSLQGHSGGSVKSIAERTMDLSNDLREWIDGWGKLCINEKIEMLEMQIVND